MTTVVLDGVTQVVVHGTVTNAHMKSLVKHVLNFVSFSEAVVLDWSQSIMALRAHQVVGSQEVRHKPVAHVVRRDQFELFKTYLSVGCIEGLRREIFLAANDAHRWVQAMRLDRGDRAIFPIRKVE